MSALAGRGAVVTGGGRGIGAAVARALAAAGARVLVAARNADETERVAAELRGRGGEAWAEGCDVGDESSVRAMGSAARGKLGAVDILVNNAGSAGSAPLGKITLEAWEEMMAVNARGVFLCTREFVPGMVERGFGRVVTVASIAGLEGARYVAHYSASKHAAIGFVRSVALELAGTGVTMNAVCPAYVDSPMTDRTLAATRSRSGVSREEALALVLATTGQKRLIRPDEVAEAVLDLCREEAKDRNGEIVTLEGKGAA